MTPLRESIPPPAMIHESGTRFEDDFLSGRGLGASTVGGCPASATFTFPSSAYIGHGSPSRPNWMRHLIVGIRAVKRVFLQSFHHRKRQFTALRHLAARRHDRKFRKTRETQTHPFRVA